jgi:hypothetical protein
LTSKALVTRDTTHVVLSRAGADVEDFSPVPGEKAGLLLSLLGLNLSGQGALWLWLSGTTLPLPALVGLGAAFTLSAARLGFGPFLMRRRLMGRSADRLRGTVEVAELSFPAPGTGDPAVLARTIFAPAGRGGRPKPGYHEDVRGVPFLLRFPDGRVARVDPTSLHLLEPMGRLPWLSEKARRALGAPLRGWFRQSVLQTALHPGDELEVLGRLVSEVDQSGTGAPARGVPLATFLRPRTGTVIWARRVKTSP